MAKKDKLTNNSTSKKGNNKIKTGVVKGEETNNQPSKEPSIFHTFLFDDVSDRTVERVVRDVINANEDPNFVEIILHIHSHGGSIKAAFTAFDYIKSSTKHVTAYVTGYCASAAVLILQAATKRIISSNARLMIHPSSFGLDRGTPFNEAMLITEEYEEAHQRFMLLSSYRTDMTPEEFDVFSNPRRTLSPDEALKAKLIDEIVEIKLERNFKKQ